MSDSTTGEMNFLQTILTLFNVALGISIIGMNVFLSMIKKRSREHKIKLFNGYVFTIMFIVILPMIIITNYLIWFHNKNMDHISIFFEVNKILDTISNNNSNKYIMGLWYQSLINNVLNSFIMIFDCIINDIPLKIFSLLFLFSPNLPFIPYLFFRTLYKYICNNNNAQPKPFNEADMRGYTHISIDNTETTEMSSAVNIESS